MAKMIGGVFSKGSGRLGGHVLAVSEGQQIIREYQPNVANPRTSMQRAQRAKVVLAGKLSQITPNEVLLGLGASKRDRRSEYTRHIINNARVQDVNGKLQAVILPGELKFSKGKFMPGVSASLDEMTDSYVRIAPSWERNVDAVMAVAVVYDARMELYNYIGWVLTTGNGDSIDIPISNVTAGAAANIYLIPLVLKTTGGRVTSSGVGDNKASYVGVLQYGSPDVYEYRESIYVGFKTKG